MRGTRDIIVDVKASHTLRAWEIGLLWIAALSVLFSWELNLFSPLLPGPPRPPTTNAEVAFTMLLIALLGLNMGLFSYRKRAGTCPIGTRRANSVAGSLGLFALLCPVCLALPLSAIGISVSLTVFAPFIPLLRVLALLLLLVSTSVLWPRKRTR